MVKVGSGPRPDCCWMDFTWVSKRLAVGRSSGLLARQLPISSRNSAGRESRRAGRLTTRYISAALDPEPNGPWPVAEKVSTAPRLKMSLGGPRTWPRACSGDMNLGEPKTQPCFAFAQAAHAIPKSIIRGPSSVSRTFEGFRSRWTTPAAWMAIRLSASPAASHSTLPTGSGPLLFTDSASDGPSTYSVASHGSGPSGSASTTGAANGSLTFLAAATSWRNCRWNSRSAASSTRMTFTATGWPSAEWPRKTRPKLPDPSCPDRRYGPIARGSSGRSGSIN